MSSIIWQDKSNLDPMYCEERHQACINGFYYTVYANGGNSIAFLMFSYLGFYEDDSTNIMKGSMDELMVYAETHAHVMLTRKNVRHDLCDIDIAYEINRSITEHDRLIKRQFTDYVQFYDRQPLAALNRFGEPFATPEEKSMELCDWGWSYKTQAMYYGNVRVIERACVDELYDGKYVLVYDDVDDAYVTTGTGGFRTVEAAKKWFFGGGR